MVSSPVARSAPRRRLRVESVPKEEEVEEQQLSKDVDENVDITANDFVITPAAAAVATPMDASAAPIDAYEAPIKGQPMATSRVKVQAVALDKINGAVAANRDQAQGSYRSLLQNVQNNQLVQTN